MFALDLFNNDHERRLNEGAVDNLEQRRIDDLAMKMDDLVARAKTATTLEVKAALMKEFKKCKDERDSYFKINTEGQVTPTATGLRHHAKPENYGGYQPEPELKGLNKTLTKNLEKGMGIEFKRAKKFGGGIEVDEAGIPGNVPADKIPGKEDLLKGRGRSYYESVEEGNPSKKVFKDKAGKPVGEIGIDPESSPGNGEWYVHHYATGYSVVGFDSAAEAKRELLYVHKHPDAVEGHPSTTEQGVTEGSEHNVGDTVNYSTKVPGFSKSAQGGQGKITKKTATHYTVNGKEMPHSHIKSRAQGVAEGGYDIMVKHPQHGSEWEHATKVNGKTKHTYSSKEKANNVGRNLMKGSTSQYAVAKSVKDEGVAEAGIPGSVPADKIPGKEDLLKGRGRLLAKAIAGQADVPFFNISGSDFVEMFVGVGASRVRDLFKQAKENSPCIIFLDEVDAIGRKRGPGFVSGGHDEREQTLNAILVEMDGFDTNDQVIVIAATNRADILDHALTRPGRFDRQIFVPLPDLKGRVDILKVHAKNVKLGPDINLERLARGTPMFSGADLAAIINEAALAATMANKDFVEMADLEEARDKVRWGKAKKSRVIDQKEKEITAYHEAGHTLVQSLIKDADPLHKVSIIPRGPMGGATFALPEKDRTIFTKRYCMALLQVCFGGRVAEEIFCDDISSGAQSDIQQATNIAKQMVLTWGMSSDLGLISYGPDLVIKEMGYILPGEKDYSEKTAETIDKEVKKITNEAYNKAKEVIQANKDKVEQIAKALLKYETLDANDVNLILEGGQLDKPTVADLLASEKAKEDKKPKNKK